MQSVTVTLIVRVMRSVTESVTVIALVLSPSCFHDEYLGYVRHVRCVHGVWESEIWIECVIDDDDV